MSQHASIWLFYLVYTTLQHFFFSFFLSIYLPLFLSFLLVLVFLIFFSVFPLLVFLLGLGPFYFHHLWWGGRRGRKGRRGRSLILIYFDNSLFIEIWHFFSVSPLTFKLVANVMFSVSTFHLGALTNWMIKPSSNWLAQWQENSMISLDNQNQCDCRWKLTNIFIILKWYYEVGRKYRKAVETVSFTSTWIFHGRWW